MGDKVPIETYNHICKSLDIAESTIKGRDKENERLKKEKEWLFNKYTNTEKFWALLSLEEVKESVLERMQQDLGGK